MWGKLQTLSVFLLAVGLKGSVSRCDGKPVFENEVIVKHVLRDYERLSRPAQSMDKVAVSVSSAGLLSIDGLLEQHEHFSFTAWLAFVWHDQRLAWKRREPHGFPSASTPNSDDSATSCAGQGVSEGGDSDCSSSPGQARGRCPHERSANTTPCSCADNNIEETVAGSNITSIRIDPSLIWMPGVFVTNSVTGFENLQNPQFEGQAMVTATGSVTWVVADRFDVRCSVNTYKFPFDTQTCYAEYATDTLLDGETLLSLRSTLVNRSAFRPNAEYILQHTSLVVTELFGTRRGLRLSVTFSRRWLFYVINSIVPVLTLSLLNTIVFLLPAHSGERVSFAVSLLLSYAIFISTITDTLPPNSTSVCLFAVYLATLTLLSAATAAINIAIMTLHNSQDQWRTQGRAEQCVCQEQGTSLARWKRQHLRNNRAPANSFSGRMRKARCVPDIPPPNSKVKVRSTVKDMAMETMQVVSCLHGNSEEPIQRAVESPCPVRTQSAVEEGQVNVNKEMKAEESEGMSAEKVDKVAFCLSLFITVSVHVLFLYLLA